MEDLELSGRDSKDSAKNSRLSWLYDYPKITSLHVENFLSYKSSTLFFDDFNTLVGPNASGKSNLVEALKILSEIPGNGIQSAVARSGGFELIRHRRTEGKSGFTKIRLEFEFENCKPSFYEIVLKPVSGKRFGIKSEAAELNTKLESFWFKNNGQKLKFVDFMSRANKSKAIEIPDGQSALGLSGMTGFAVARILSGIHIIDVNPMQLGELQDPSISRHLESDGSNSTSVFENMTESVRTELIWELSSILPEITNIEVLNLANKQTLTFTQGEGKARKKFFASQMSDGTLRAFGILIALRQGPNSGLIVIEEPERAIHLGALKSLIEIVRSKSPEIQVLVTTHSADIVNSTPHKQIRVVWKSDSETSEVSYLAEHTVDLLSKLIMRPGELLRTYALDPETKNVSPS